MQRVFKDVTPGAKFHDLPEVHNGHPMADAFYDGHIMGNKEEGNAEFFLEGQKEVDDLGTYGYVEGGNGFVGNDDFRIHRQGAGDTDALALPAMNAPRTDTSTTTTVRITTSNGMRGRLTALMMDMILAAITRMTRAMALAARTDAFTVLFAPRTAFTGVDAAK